MEPDNTAVAVGVFERAARRAIVMDTIATARTHQGDYVFTTAAKYTVARPQL